MEHELTNWAQFYTAGNATFTIRNEATGNRLTYRVRKHKEKPLWFVSVLSGPDNTYHYRYVGTVFADGNFALTRNSKCSNEAPAYRVFAWLHSLARNGKDLPASVHMYHENKCGRCGRKLTVPASITSGFGPECITHVAAERMLRSS